MIENENPGVETLPYTSRTSCWSFPASGETIHDGKTIHTTALNHDLLLANLLGHQGNGGLHPLSHFCVTGTRTLC